MTSRTASCLREAVDHLPEAAILIVPQVTWDEYEQLLEGLVDRPGVRVSYDEGTLQIMTTSAEHEEYKDFILRLVSVFSEERRIPLESRGAATWKRRTLRKGAEADVCFYTANAPRIIGRRKIDLHADPPPDVVVEIDIANESLNKFRIYAAFGVPEIWRYDGTRVQMYGLTSGAYTPRPASVLLPGLDPGTIAEYLEQSRTQGQTEALRAFREHLRRTD